MSYSFTLEQMDRFAMSESRLQATYDFLRNFNGIGRGIYLSERQTLDSFSLLCSQASRPGFLSSCLALSFDPDEYPSYDQYELYVHIREAKIQIRIIERDHRSGIIDEEDFKTCRSNAVRHLKALLMGVEF